MQSVRSTSFDGCRSFERSTVTMSWTLSGWKPATCELRCSWVQNRADMLNVLTKFNGSVRKCVRTFSDAVCNMMRYDVIYRYDVMGAFVFFFTTVLFSKRCVVQHFSMFCIGSVNSQKIIHAAHNHR